MRGKGGVAATHGRPSNAHGCPAAAPAELLTTLPQQALIPRQEHSPVASVLADALDGLQGTQWTRLLPG
jgi:hypothetical protein